MGVILAVEIIMAVEIMAVDALGIIEAESSRLDLMTDSDWATVKVLKQALPAAQHRFAVEAEQLSQEAAAAISIGVMKGRFPYGFRPCFFNLAARTNWPRARPCRK